MPTNFLKNVFTIILSATMITNVVSAEEKLSFDPFISEADQNDTPSGNYNASPVIPEVEFNNNDISMAFQIISDATGWSIFPTPDVSRAKISLWAKNVPADTLLDTIVTMAGFVYHRDADLITVMTYEEYMQHHGLAKKTFVLKYAPAESVDAIIKPFLTKLGKSVVHKQTCTIVLYDTDANLKFITALIEKLDIPAENIIVDVIRLKYADCDDLAKVLTSAFSTKKDKIRNKSHSKTETSGDTVKDKSTDTNTIDISEEEIGIYPVNQSNQLVIVGTADGIKIIRSIVEKIDIRGDNMVLEVIDLEYADSEVVAESLNQMFEEGDTKKDTKIFSSRQKTSPDQQENPPANGRISDLVVSPQAKVFIKSIGRTNQLIIRAFIGDLEKIKTLIEKLDKWIEPVSMNYQFTYVDASEIFSGLENILNLRTGNISRGNEREKKQGLTLIEMNNSILLTAPPSTHRIMTSIVEKVDKPATYEAGMIKVYKLENADVEEVAKTIAELIGADETSKEETYKDSKVKVTDKTESSSPQAPTAPELTETEHFTPRIKARVSVSKSTNSVIVQATARQHRELEKLVKKLDTLRKQVLIEAMIVELTDTDNLNLGVELGRTGGDFSAFSAFGLSTELDPTTGTRDIVVSPGATAAVLRPDKLYAILQTLRQYGKARITSSPRILVNDNSVGYINSVAEEPTTQTNLGQTTTTTSFAGFVEAGTQFAITPHISDNNYLRVEYQITLNSFGTKSTDPSIPPPRNTSSIQSQATVPDGFTIIVGGLQTTDQSENVDKVPLLGDIPVLEWVFKNTKIEKQRKRTYLFITPHIMSEESFADLKTISQKTLGAANSDNDKQN